MALAPAAVSDGEIETMFGGFFAGADGKQRRLKFGDSEAKTASGFQVLRGAKGLIDGLAQRPVECIHRALYAIGYSPGEEIRQGGGSIVHILGQFDKSLVFCLSQFHRHFATGARICRDQSAAYAEIALGKKDRHNKIDFDLELAKLLRGAEIAASVPPRPGLDRINVDQ